ncbi:MAG: DNA topoisomerase I [Nanoarchaeota archaeon]|nr:DNA topoisomerase I [Nanoarchaeota archaeon]
MSTLIITEKPIACQKIVRALSDNAKIKVIKGVKTYEFKKGNETYYAAPAVGHLFNLKHKKGAKTPIFEVEWTPTHSFRDDANYTKKYYEAFLSLKKKAKKFIVATDYDTEGSVIAYTILKYLFEKTDAERMKFSTLTKDELQHSFEKRNKHLNKGMINAGELRHLTDYYWGINSSRALMESIKSAGRFKILSMGRVQGPMLKVLYEREIEIENFKSKPYWEISITFEGVEAFHPQKIWKPEQAKKVYESAKSKTAKITEIKQREYTQPACEPFNLTILQTEAYSHINSLPSKTLELAQKLYEKGMISYPRTSSQQLPPSIGYKKIINKLAKQSKYENLCNMLLDKKELKPVDGKKTDPAHPAIYPTGSSKPVRGKELKLYDLIVKRFLASFAEPALKKSVTYTINSKGFEFTAHGKQTIKQGWIKYYDYILEDDVELPEHTKNDTIHIDKSKKHSKKTQPPNRFSQASLIKLMDKEEIGTKATRSDILKTLYYRGYLTGKSVTVTELGRTIVEILEKYSPKIISKSLTMEVDKNMDLVLHGKLKKEKALEHSKKAVKAILKDFEKHNKKIGKELVEALKDDAILSTCPKCKKGKLVIIRSRRTGKRFVGCDNYPKCSNSFPLPQNGKIQVLHKTCKECGMPVVRLIRRGKRPWDLCININCSSKDYLKKNKK